MGAELVSLEIDVLVVVGNNAAPYANDLTTAIPVVLLLLVTGCSSQRPLRLCMV
jgi:hypothetical protein